MIDFFGGLKQSSKLTVDQRDAQLQFLMRQYQSNPTMENLVALEQEIATTKRFNQVFSVIKAQFGLTGVTAAETNFDCYKSAVKALETRFGKANDYALKNFRYLFEYC